MLDEHTLRAELRACLSTQIVPALDLDGIYTKRAKLAQPARTQWTRRRFAAAAALVVAALLCMPQARAVVADRLTEALHAMGIETGPPVPRSIVTALQTQTHAATFEEAAKDVDFGLTAPRGVPSDARLARIIVAPVAQREDRQNARWEVGPHFVTFDYTRANGTSFSLDASRYDPAATLSAYLWKPAEDQKGDAVIQNGRVQSTRNTWLHWRNGDQLMSAVANDALTESEALAIQNAMHGTPLPGVKTTKPHAGRVLRIAP